MKRLFLSSECLRVMNEDVGARYPHEACGLLAGVEGVCQKAIPLPNAVVSPYRCRVDNGELARALWSVANQGLRIMAVYHSHPFGKAEPSRLDVELAHFATVQLIWAYKENTWIVRGFMFTPEGRFIPLEIVPKTGKAL